MQQLTPTRGRFDAIKNPLELNHLEIAPPLDVAHALSQADASKAAMRTRLSMNAAPKISRSYHGPSPHLPMWQRLGLNDA